MYDLFLLALVLGGAVWLWSAISRSGDRRGRPRRRKRITEAERDSLRSAVGREGEERVSALVRSMGLPILDDVYLDNGRGETVQIDHLVDLGNRIAVLETKNWAAGDGGLNGRVDDGQWVRDGKPFSNPIRQNAYHVTALKRVIGGTHVLPLVVFAGDAEPPLGTGEFAVHIDDLPARLTVGQRHPAVEHVWRRLEEIDRHTDKVAIGAAHVARIKSDRAGRRRWH